MYHICILWLFTAHLQSKIVWTPTFLGWRHHCFSPPQRWQVNKLTPWKIRGLWHILMLVQMWTHAQISCLLDPHMECMCARVHGCLRKVAYLSSLLLLLHLKAHLTKCSAHSKVPALSGKPTLNMCAFKCFAKFSGPTDRSLNSAGNAFQMYGVHCLYI